MEGYIEIFSNFFAFFMKNFSLNNGEKNLFKKIKEVGWMTSHKKSMKWK